MTLQHLEQTVSSFATFRTIFREFKPFLARNKNDLLKKFCNYPVFENPTKLIAKQKYYNQFPKVIISLINFCLIIFNSVRYMKFMTFSYY